MITTDEAVVAAIDACCRRLNITPDEYHARPEISSGGIRLFAAEGAPMYYAACVTRTVAWKETDAQRLGACEHILFETPGKWEQRIEIIPARIERRDIAGEINDDLDARNSGAKRIREGDHINAKLPAHREYMGRMKTEAEREGKLWCTEAESVGLCGQLEAILADPKCREIVEAGGNREQAAINVHKGTGLGIRALADVDDPGVRGTDLKTTRMRTSSRFAWDAQRRRYHYQLAHYADVFTDWKETGIIAVTNEPPYYAMHFQFDAELMAEAREANGWVLADLHARYQDKDNPESWRPDGYGRTTVIGREGADRSGIEWDE